MKRTKPREILRPDFFQLDVVADDADDIRLLLDRVREIAGVGHVGKLHCSEGIVRDLRDDWNMPEMSCCGETVEGAVISLIVEEKLARALRASLNSQLDHRRPAPTFILRGLSYRFHMRMLLQILAKRFPENSHATAMYHAHPGQSREECAIQKLLDLSGGIVYGPSDYVNF